jgi:HD domain
LDDAAIETIRRGALLHDIGKIAIGETLLQKRSPLTPEEIEVMRKHPAIGAQIVQHVKSLSHVVPLVLYHQEKYDGTGYPRGLRGPQIPLGARIIAVADAYHAMTSDRPYRQSMSPQQAVAELLRCAGTHFDPLVVDAFLCMLQQRTTTAHEDATAAGHGSADVEQRAASRPQPSAIGYQPSTLRSRQREGDSDAGGYGWGGQSLGRWTRPGSWASSPPGEPPLLASAGS